jgi:hypothetical protein
MRLLRSAVLVVACALAPAAASGQEDTTPPVLASLSFSPAIVDVSEGGADVTVAVRVTDALSGFSRGWAYFVSPSGSQVACAWLYAENAVSGDVHDGEFEARLTLPRYSEGGTWRLSYVLLNDAVGLRADYDGTMLGAMGVQTEFVVNAEQSPPDAIRALARLVEGYGLGAGLGNALDAKLQGALAALEAANAAARQDAANKLQAFINAVEAQRGKRLTAAQADQLITSAQEILAALG